MKWALLFALGGTGAVIVGLCIVALFVRHRINRRHRVDHTVPTDAPLTWLVDPRQPARLHRRLTRVGRTAIVVGDDHRPATKRLRKREPDPPIVSVADDLRRQAVAIDQQLARLAVLAPRARHQPLLDLGRSVDELERAATRLLALSTEVRTPRTLDADHPGLLDVAGQIDRLAEAHEALLAIDAEQGLAPLSPRQVPTDRVRPWSTPSS